jgi:hypothetical protein
MHARMEPERDPIEHDLASAGLSALREIEECDEEKADALLSAFLCAAWPSIIAQRQ